MRPVAARLPHTTTRLRAPLPPAHASAKAAPARAAAISLWNDLAAAQRRADRHPAARVSPTRAPSPGRLRAIFADRAYLALTLRRRPNDAVRLHDGRRRAPARVPTVATGDVLYHAPRRHILADVLTCIREGRTIDEIGHDASAPPIAT